MQSELLKVSPFFQHATNKARKSKLVKNPPKIELMIFERLDPVSSTFLGLCSKLLYPIHGDLHGKVSLIV